MKSIIEQLFVGDINSFEQFTRTDEYEKCSSEIVKEEEEFFKKINKEEKEMFDNISDMGAHLSLIESKIHFVYGFKAGFKLGAEIYSEKNA